VGVAGRLYDETHMAHSGKKKGGDAETGFNNGGLLVGKGNCVMFFTDWNKARGLDTNVQQVHKQNM